MSNEAPGKPGIAPKWTSSQKNGIGTSLSAESLVWFTLSHGIINEVYFPNTDTPNTRDMQFLVTNGKDFFSEEKKDTISTTQYITPGIPAYKVINTCIKGKYQIVKTIFVNPFNNVLIQKVQFIALQGAPSDYKIFMLLAPHIKRYGSGNNGWVDTYKGVPMLYASREEIHLALCCSKPFLKRSCGYVGSSDGWLDIHANYTMTKEYTSAMNGNIALTAEIDLKDPAEEFILSMGFGGSSAEASKQAHGTILMNCDYLLSEFCSQWEQKQDNAIKLSQKHSEIDKFYRSSIMVLNSHLDKRSMGTVIASLSIPWGTSKGDDDLGGYHLIWPRDLVEIAGGFLAYGDTDTARKILYFLMAIQEEDGHYNQCMWHDGSPYWSNIQMDETALPILLANALKTRKALKWLDPWPMVERATRYLIQHGPVTPQDRWEEDGGYTPFTLAAEIAALLVGADFFTERGLEKEAKYLTEAADYWNSKIEDWTYVTNTHLSKEVGVEGYYVRITPPNFELSESQNPIIEVKNRPPDHTFNPASEIISADALALVRFGLRDAKDPKILNTVKVIDALLKRDTQSGPVWKRYNEDGYGEQEDGSDFNGTGIGRGWPLLVGERAHYELAKGDMRQVKFLLDHLIMQSGKNYLLPEQIWDTDSIPEKMLINGEPTLGAMPLVWAHSEGIKLLRSIKDKKVFDMPIHAFNRYSKNPPSSPLVFWKPNHKTRKIAHGKILRIEQKMPFRLKWSSNNGASVAEISSIDSGLSLYYVDIPTDSLHVGHSIQFNFYFDHVGSWDSESFIIEIIEGG